MYAVLSFQYTLFIHDSLSASLSPSWHWAYSPHHPPVAALPLHRSS